MLQDIMCNLGIHRWKPWEEPGEIVVHERICGTRMAGKVIVGQTRRCQRCGVIQAREIQVG